MRFDFSIPAVLCYCLMWFTERESGLACILALLSFLACSASINGLHGHDSVISVILVFLSLYR